MALPTALAEVHSPSPVLLAGTIYVAPSAPGGTGLASLVGIVFLLFTMPTGSYVISQAAERTGVEFTGDAVRPDTGKSWPESPDEGDE